MKLNKINGNVKIERRMQTKSFSSHLIHDSLNIKIQRYIIKVKYPNAWLSFHVTQNRLQKGTLQFSINILYFTKSDLAVAFYVHLCKCKHKIYIINNETIPITPH
jgi:hypothetical protein